MEDKLQKLVKFFQLEATAGSTNFDGLDGENVKMKKLLLDSNKAQLLGSTPEEKVEVTQWMSFAASQPFDDATLKKLDSFLLLESYLASNKFTAADGVVYVTIMIHWKTVSELIKNYPSVCRWLDHIQRLGSVPELNTVVTRSPTVFTIPVLSATQESVKAEPTKNDKKPTETEKPKDSKTQEKKDKPSKEEGKKKKGGAKEEKGKAPEAVPSAAGNNLDPSKLDIRCGLVVKCWNHPESEKLLCEEIDLGKVEDGGLGVRMVASGIRANYSAEEVQGRKVLVVSNLKERPMAGFKSQGMVLCACNEDHSVAKLLQPPEKAKPGDRVSFPGFSGEPAPASQVAKKKILEGLAPLLRTDASGVVHWGEVPFTIDSEVCTAPLPNAIVS